MLGISCCKVWILTPNSSIYQPFLHLSLMIALLPILCQQSFLSWGLWGEYKTTQSNMGSWLPAKESDWTLRAAWPSWMAWSIDELKIWVGYWKAEELWEVGPNEAVVAGILPWFLLLILPLLPVHYEVSGLCHRLLLSRCFLFPQARINRSKDFELMPMKLWAKRMVGYLPTMCSPRFDPCTVGVGKGGPLSRRYLPNNAFLCWSYHHLCFGLISLYTGFICGFHTCSVWSIYTTLKAHFPVTLWCLTVLLLSPSMFLFKVIFDILAPCSSYAF